MAKHEQVVRKEGKNYVFGVEENPKFLTSGQLPLGDIKNEGGPSPQQFVTDPTSRLFMYKARKLGGFSSNKIDITILS